MRKKAPRRVSESLPLSDFPGAELPQHRNERLKHEEGNEKIADGVDTVVRDPAQKPGESRAEVLDKYIRYLVEKAEKQAVEP